MRLRHHKHARLVAAIKIGRPLRKSEHVHHVNGDPTDDRFENLAVLTEKKHLQLHALERRRFDRTCSGCDQPVLTRTFGCQPCAVRHNKWRTKGFWYLPAHTRRKDNMEYAL